MQLSSRKLVDRSFTGLGIFSIFLVTVFLGVILLPIIWKGAQAVIFRGTIEHREFILSQFDRGDRDAIQTQIDRAQAARRPVFEMLAEFEQEMQDKGFLFSRKYENRFKKLKEELRELLGPLPGDESRPLLRDTYGATRWDQAREALQDVLYATEYDYSDPTKMGVKVLVPRSEKYEGTTLQPLFAYIENNAENMLLPQWTCYWHFFLDRSFDAHFFGGIWAELLGTFYLTIGAIIFAVPMGVISAIYLVEYADPESRLVGLIRTCINTLAGVPSIVFGLFGLAFFINSIHVSSSKSVLAGSLTLAVLVLPVIIRAAEEAIRAVPQTYKEASLSLGTSKWRTVVTVILPAALPGVLTGIVISMGRAAGETAPIIFTAAVSMGPALAAWETLDQPTRALPWNIYNLCSEHRAVDEIRHVQFGMVFTLVMLVLMLNSIAILLRARISKKLRG
jgi:phosphate transport system permease protein